MLSVIPLLYLFFLIIIEIQNTKATRGIQTCFDQKELETARDDWFLDKASAEAKYGSIGDWSFCQGTSVITLFYNKGSFNEDLSQWDVGSMTSMYRLFYKASSFNGELNQWDVSKVSNMSWLFDGASSFNGDLSKWDTSAVESMMLTFGEASLFSGGIHLWDVSRVTSMFRMFDGASSFNEDLSNWDTTKVITMYGMFSGASSFNGDLSGWDTGEVTSMYRTFYDALSFNRNISRWNVAKVMSMYEIFSGTSSFNQCLDWDVEAADTTAMFDEGVGETFPNTCFKEPPTTTPRPTNNLYSIPTNEPTKLLTTSDNPKSPPTLDSVSSVNVSKASNHKANVFIVCNGIGLLLLPFLLYQ